MNRISLSMNDIGEKESSEEEMVALFLKTEIDSARWRPKLLRVADDLECPIEILKYPDTTVSADNRLRAKVLARFRGYGEDRDLFESYPDEVVWHWVMLDHMDLNRTKYVNYSYWNELTDGSRRPMDAAATIREGIEVFGVSNEGFLKSAAALRNGAKFPEPILLAPKAAGDLIILEGHVRITAYALAGSDAPYPMLALLGLASGFSSWL